MITINNLHKEYKTKDLTVKALNNINLQFTNTGLVSILGPSGCGKTTLLNIIGGLDSEYSGEVIVNNQNIALMSESRRDIYRNQDIGFVFQDYNLISTLNVYDNIEMALALSSISLKQKRLKISKIAEQLGIYKLLKKYPHQLSGGEKQRVVIARAIINDASIILADEPTGALDSKTSKQILDILKDISKTRLVIMVTHNQELANEYSDDIIRVQDGNIIGQEKKSLRKVDKIEKKNRKVIKHPFYSIFKISYHNLLNKWLRTILIILACSIGIVALCIVVTVANGMSLYISDVQKQALKTYPITINSDVSNDEPEYEDITYEQYPDTDKVFITDTQPTYKGHVNTFTNEFMTYIKSMNSDLYSAISYTGWLKMHIMHKNQDDTYSWISGYSYMKELCYNEEYLQSEYDILTGKIPEGKNQIALVIDKTNCISRDVLEYLGLYYDGQTEISFNDVIGTKYRVIDNNSYYVKRDNRYLTYNQANISNEDIYNGSSLELEIVGILRQNKEAKTKLYNTTLLYTPDLTQYMLEQNAESEVVKQQLANPLVNVLTGKEYKEIVTDYYVQTIDYQYENMLYNLGYNYTVSRILIYTYKFENFALIHDYIESYNEDKIEISQIKYTDYLENITKEFELFMDILTNVLLVFALISIVVAGIMIVIITYVSVLEQTKEIGILRSVGVNQFNVSCVFIYENAIIGFISGILGVTLGSILINPILNKIIVIIKESNVTSFNVESLQMDGFNIIYMIILVLASTIITIVSGLIPSIIAAKKDPIKTLNHF